MGLGWTPDGRILFADRHFDLWLIDRNSTNRQLLTPDEHSNRHPFATPDGQHVVFESWRQATDDKGCGFWIMRADGTSAKFLAPTSCSAIAVCAGDCSWIYFDRHTGETGIWKVPVEGGDAVRVIDEDVVRPAISPDASRIAALSVVKDELLVYDIEGGTPEMSFPAPADAKHRVVRWTPDGKAVAYVKTEAGVSNLWLQPLDGSTPKQITRFQDDQIFYFDWYHDGSIAIARGRTQNDVMLLKLQP
jgi:Tol biopolymer transport system component